MWLSVIWFVGLAGLGVACAIAGRLLARRSERAARNCIALAVFGVMIAAVPKFHPIFIHGTLPLEISVWVEGVLAVFPWMALVGALSVETFAPRLRRLAPLLFILGIVYFLFGGIWMVLPAIDLPRNQQLGPTEGLGGMVWQQSRSDTCVPAACATALSLLGVTTSEREMCHVVQAKPTRGSTLARAALGLRNHLEPRGFRVELIYLRPTDLALMAEIDQPFLVVIRSSFGMDHMIVVLGHSSLGVVVANPSPGVHGSVRPIDMSALEPAPPHGIEFYRPEAFVRMLRPGAIAIMPPEGWRLHVANAREVQRMRRALQQQNPGEATYDAALRPESNEEVNDERPDESPDGEIDDDSPVQNLIAPPMKSP